LILDSSFDSCLDLLVLVHSDKLPYTWQSVITKPTLSSCFLWREARTWAKRYCYRMSSVRPSVCL